MSKITKRLVEATKAKDKDIIIWDSEIKGFHCKVTPKGKRVYGLYYRTQDGRQRKPLIGVHGQITCDQARNKAQQWLVEANNGKDPSLERQSKRDSLTIKALAEKYLHDYAEIYKKKISVTTDKLHLKNHILPKLGQLKLLSITTKDIIDLHRNMHDRPIAANSCIALLSKMFNLAEKWGLRVDAGTLCKHVDRYPENKRDRFLSMSEIEKLFIVLQEAEIKKAELPSTIAAIKLLLLTGCRLSEILTLKWEYIDIENHRFNFPDSKTGKKTIYISPYTLEVLNAIERKRDNPYVIYGIVEGSHLVNLRKPWCRIRKKAGLDDVRLHDLRHSFASIGVASGLSLPIIGTLLGHTQVKTTARYAHLIGDPLKEAANLIGEKIRSVIR